MYMEVFLQKEHNFPGTHKIGAAISDPRIAGKRIYGHEDFSDSNINNDMFFARHGHSKGCRASRWMVFKQALSGPNVAVFGSQEKF